MKKGEKYLVTTAFPVRSGGKKKFSVIVGTFVKVIKVKTNRVSFSGEDGYRREADRGAFTASTEALGGTDAQKG